MQYFGIPTCPYCKKRVNIIRTWSLKRQGEYQCPRCRGISNVYLSPLVYVFALIAIFAGAAIYFFHKFILDDINLSILIQVLIPFACFFLLSLFTVRLEKPVIKKVSKAELERKKNRGRNRQEAFRQGAVSRTPQYNTQSLPQEDYGDYYPETDYSTGPAPQRLPENPAKKAEFQSYVKDYETEYDAYDPPAPRRQEPENIQKTMEIPVQKAPAVRENPQRVPAPAPTAPPRRKAPVSPPAEEAPRFQVSIPEEGPRKESRVVSSVEVPSPGGKDFFSKYDDPEYIERRLKELREKEK